MKQTGFIRYTFFAVIVITLLIRLSFVGKGAIAFPDENRYLRSFIGLEALVDKGDTKTFFGHIVINVAIPVNQIIQMVPCMLQLYLKKTTGLSPENPTSLIIPQVFNIGVFVVILFLLYKVITAFFSNQVLALGAVLICAFLSNMNIYSRHLGPYDNAVMMTLISLLFYLRSNFISSPIRVFYLGILSSLTFATYPGYYIVPGMLFALCISNKANWQNSKGLIKMCVLFVSGFLMVTAFFEVLGRLGGTSYIVSMLTASGKITQGDFSDGFIFVPRYMYCVEGVIGTCLFLLYLCGVMVAFKQTIAKRQGNIELLILLSFGAMLLHCSQCYFLHKMVWYGRLVHIYIPFIIIGVSYLFHRLSVSEGWKNMALAALVTAGGAHFLIFAHGYLFDIAYPRDVLYNLRINSLILGKDHFINQFEITNNVDQVPGAGKTLNFHIAAPLATDSNYYSKDTTFYLVNCGLIWPVEENKSFAAQRLLDNRRLIFSSTYVSVFPGYLYEGYDNNQRMLFTKKDVKIEVYKKI